MRGLLLKTGTTALAVVATVVSSLYVTTHLKNPSAPLQPSVLSGGSATLLGGSVTVGPSVKPRDVQPVTSTYAS